MPVKDCKLHFSLTLQNNLHDGILTFLHIQVMNTVQLCHFYIHVFQLIYAQIHNIFLNSLAIHSYFIAKMKEKKFPVSSAFDIYYLESFSSILPLKLFCIHRCSKHYMQYFNISLFYTQRKQNFILYYL